MAHQGVMMVYYATLKNLLNEALESLHPQDLAMVDQLPAEPTQNKQKHVTLYLTLSVSRKFSFMESQVEALVPFISLLNTHRK